MDLLEEAPLPRAKVGGSQVRDHKHARTANDLGLVSPFNADFRRIYLDGLLS